MNTKILIKLEGASIEATKTKVLSSKFLSSINIVPLAKYTKIIAVVPASVKLKASKTSDSYGLRLRFSKDTPINNKTKITSSNTVINSSKMLEAHKLKVYPFRYYNTMTWITRTLRSHKKHILDMYFLMNHKVQRYHDLYNKLYIGFMNLEDVSEMLNLAKDEYSKDLRVVVAIEKKHSDEIVLTYYIQKTRKNLYLYSFDEDGVLSKEKKDPYGITVTEVYHSNKIMDDSYILTMADNNKIKKLLKDNFLNLKK